MCQRDGTTGISIYSTCFHVSRSLVRVATEGCFLPKSDLHDDARHACWVGFDWFVGWEGLEGLVNRGGGVACEWARGVNIKGGSSRVNRRVVSSKVCRINDDALLISKFRRPTNNVSLS